MTYKLKTKSLAKQAMAQASDEAVAPLQPPDGEITNPSEALIVAEWLPVADSFIKGVRAKLKAWAQEHGDVRGGEGTVWGPQISRTEKRLSMKLDELVGMLARHRVPYDKIDAIEAELREKGIGEVSESSRYGWHK